MPSPAAAGIPAATVYAFPSGALDSRAALAAMVMVLIPALLMVSTIRFRSFKTIDLQVRRPYTLLLLIAGAIILVTTHPPFVLVAMAYTYLVSPIFGALFSRFRRKDDAGDDVSAPARPATHRH